MNVFSCFDGASCGQLALKKLGITFDGQENVYYASEIDKYAIQVTQANFPNTIQLGDITEVGYRSFNHHIGLMMGGSPCQGFSFAGKQLNFDDPRSKLFFDFIRIRDELLPKYVLLENVRMSKESQDIISKYMGCEPIRINSSLLSAQSRNRLYWLAKYDWNLEKYVPILTMQPQDKGIMLKDILEDLPFGDIPNYLANSWSGEPRGNKVKSVDDPKANCLTASMYKGQIPTYIKKLIPKENPTTSKDGLIRVGSADLKGHDSIKRVYSRDGKAPTLTTMQGGHREPKVALSGYAWRKLTPLECERLQTMPDNYTNHVSNTQRYKMIGNGWTVDVIAHILKGIQHG
jgi:DNA (cytosine-5)-methyltransferase 3A